MFDISALNGTANILTEGTYAHVYATGTSVPGVIDVIIDGYRFDVSVSGSSVNAADIMAIPLTSKGCFSYGDFPLTYHIASDVPHTFKDAVSFQHISLRQLGGRFISKPPCTELSFNHLFYAYDYSVAGVLREISLRRINLLTTEEEVYMPAGPTYDNKFGGFFAVYNDNVVYTLETALTGSKMEIRKVNFCNGTASSNLVHEFDIQQSYNAQDYFFVNVYYMSHFQYEDNDCIVLVVSFQGTDPEWVLKVIIYDINSEVITEDFVDLSTNNYNFDISAMYASAPSTYKNKFIFVISPDGIRPSFPAPTACVIPTFIIDIDTKNTTRVENYTVDLNSNWLYVYPPRHGTVIDNGIEKFYFIVWNNSVGEYQLFSMDLGTELIAFVSSSADLFLYQGFPDCYGVDLSNGYVKTIPGLTTIATIPEVPLGYSSIFIDSANDIIWSCNDGEFKGVSLDNTDTGYVLDIDWVGGSLPFSYPNNQRVYVRPLAGICIVFLYSNDGTNYAQQWYLLRRCV